MDANQISAAVFAHHVVATVLGEADRERLLLDLQRRLGVDARSTPWDHEDAPNGVHRSDGWKLVAGYATGAPCLVFLSGAETIWSFTNGGDVERVLRDCPAGEFYLCDREASYLLCSNHHDYVVGWGVAREWVSALEARQ
jgi:hypothetical protein